MIEVIAAGPSPALMVSGPDVVDIERKREQVY